MSAALTQSTCIDQLHGDPSCIDKDTRRTCDDGGTLTTPRPIDTAQAFFEWFSGIEEDMEKRQEEGYR
ncbi:MAG: hypothetical protein ACPGR1_06890 [Candidatus Poseidoniaceae archaeon]